MAAIATTWIYGAHLAKVSPRRYATAKQIDHAFADLRGALAKELGGRGFGIDCLDPGESPRISLIGAVMDRLVK
jgi:hypothetical protein